MAGTWTNPQKVTIGLTTGVWAADLYRAWARSHGIDTESDSYFHGGIFGSVMPAALGGAASAGGAARAGRAATTAKSGLSLLDEGAAKVPSSWGPGLANKKGVGIRWTDPANQGNGIRIDQGIPGSGFPSQQVDHVVVRSGGKIVGPDGKPIVGSLAENPQAHIPLRDWLKWAEWNNPG